ncbi:MAG: hypothetical protein IJ689_01625 [Alphaproteobacteria bacterium]|nr:hypothetical protein [Alphaproteobacteria bacterium]
MTNKTFLILLLAGISYTAYNAAAVSEDFAISTIIDHEIVLGNLRTASTDANLDVTGNISLGTITINSTYGTGEVYYTSSGLAFDISEDGDIIAATSQTPGYFSADISDPAACDGREYSCGGLMVPQAITFIYVKGSHESGCELRISHITNNNFKVWASECWFNRASPGTYTQTFTISYTPS